MLLGLGGWCGADAQRECLGRRATRNSPKEPLIALSLQIEEFDLEPEFNISCLRYTRRFRIQNTRQDTHKHSCGDGTVCNHSQ
jgi:hypothetical protein